MLPPLFLDVKGHHWCVCAMDFVLVRAVFLSVRVLMMVAPCADLETLACPPTGFLTCALRLAPRRRRCLRPCTRTPTAPTQVRSKSILLSLEAWTGD
jgi:hypothetical protein